MKLGIAQQKLYTAANNNTIVIYRTDNICFKCYFHKRISIGNKNEYN